MPASTDLRSRLIRLAHEQPSLRADILPLLKSGASHMTWQYAKEQAAEQYLTDVTTEARNSIIDAGGTVKNYSASVKLATVSGMLRGEDVSATWLFGIRNDIIAFTSEFGKESRKGTLQILDMSPRDVVSESLYKPFQGLLP